MPIELVEDDMNVPPTRHNTLHNDIEDADNSLALKDKEWLDITNALSIKVDMMAKSVIAMKTHTIKPSVRFEDIDKDKALEHDARILRHLMAQDHAYFRLKSSELSKQCIDPKVSVNWSFINSASMLYIIVKKRVTLLQECADIMSASHISIEDRKKEVTSLYANDEAASIMLKGKRWSAKEFQAQANRHRDIFRSLTGIFSIININYLKLLDDVQTSLDDALKKMSLSEKIRAKVIKLVNNVKRAASAVKDFIAKYPIIKHLAPPETENSVKSSLTVAVENAMMASQAIVSLPVVLFSFLKSVAEKVSSRTFKEDVKQSLDTIQSHGSAKRVETSMSASDSYRVVLSHLGMQLAGLSKKQFNNSATSRAVHELKLKLQETDFKNADARTIEITRNLCQLYPVDKIESLYDDVIRQKKSRPNLKYVYALVPNMRLILAFDITPKGQDEAIAKHINNVWLRSFADEQIKQITEDAEKLRHGKNA